MKKTLSPGIYIYIYLISAILLRELGKRWGCFATSKLDFIGRDDYERSLWFTSQQINPGVCLV